MNKIELIELVNEIDYINADLYNQFKTIDSRGKEHCNPWIWMEIQYGVGQAAVVEFLGEYLYNSANEEREFNEDKNDYEPIGPYLRTKANKLLTKLQKVKL